MSCHEADEHTTVPGGRVTGFARTAVMRKAMNNIRENEFGSANVRGEVAFFSETGSEEIGRGEENVPPRVKTWNKWCSPTDFQTWIHASRDILLYPARCVCCYRVWWFRVAVIVSQNIKKATWVIKMLSR